jgi:hypothetical protein
MKNEVIKRLRKIEDKLKERKIKLMSCVDVADGIEVYLSKDMFSMVCNGVTVELFENNLQMTFADFDNWNMFTFSEWLEGVEMELGL